MIIPLLDRMSDSNPQLFRELKGRLKSHNMAIAIATSVVSQILLLLLRLAQLPGEKDQYSQYCDAQPNGYCAINWLAWWGDLHEVLCWILPLVLVGGGAYLLISDLAREESRGTLNFIRLSPQSCPSVLKGKLLGVPVLVYLGTAIALPLHLWSAIAAQVPVSWIIGFYAIVSVYSLLFYSAASLYALMGGSQGWIGAGGTVGVLWILLSLDFRLAYDFYIGTGTEQWYGLPFGSNLLAFRALVVFNGIIGTYWIWQALPRRFRNPSTTVISKKQSYLLVAYFELFLLGFVWPLFPSDLLYDLLKSLSVIALVNLVLFLGLIAALCPHRQTLQDWARYQIISSQKLESDGHWGLGIKQWASAAVNPSKIRSQKPIKMQGLLRELISGEKSPAVVAIAINLAIAAAIFVPWILLWPTDITPKIDAIAQVVFGLSLVLIYAIIAQIMLTVKTPKRIVWAIASVGFAIAFPPFVLAGLGIQTYEAPGLFLFTIFSFLGLEHASATTVFLAFLGHLAILTGLSLKLTQQLNRVGESATKALLTSSNPV